MGSNELENLVSCFSLLDAYEPKPGAKSDDFTWYASSGASASRLDRVYVLITTLGAEFFLYTNHKILHCSLKFSAKNVISRKSYWQLNSSVLEDEMYIKLIKDLMNDSKTLNLANDSIREWWDDLKKRIKKVSITHYAVRKKENKKEENELKTKSKYEIIPAKVNSL